LAIVHGEIQIELQEQPDTGSGLDSWIVVVKRILYRKPACECYLSYDKYHQRIHEQQWKSYLSQTAKHQEDIAHFLVLPSVTLQKLEESSGIYTYMAHIFGLYTPNPYSKASRFVRQNDTPKRAQRGTSTQS
jgi:hypothetical protein